MKIRIGTRKSRLALAQTELVVNAITSAFPDVETEIVHITTKGDKILDKPLLSIGGKGVFIAEIERALLSGDIDIAVHSAKDLPAELAHGTTVAAVLKRDDPRDVFVTRRGTALPECPVVGTGSLRRRKGFANVCPEAVFADIRGNVDTRLAKLSAGEFDGIILAAAGLNRLGMADDSRFDYRPLETTELLPAPCQATVAVQSRVGEFTDILANIDHQATFTAFCAEREVLRLLNAGCTMPVGAFAELLDGELSLTVTLDHSRFVTEKGTAEQWRQIAERAVSRL